MARNAKSVLIVDSLDIENFSLTEYDNDLYKYKIEDLFNLIHETPRFGVLPQIYSGATKGGTVSTRDEVFDTAYELLIASFGSIEAGDTGQTIFLSILDTDIQRLYTGNWYLEEETLKCLESSEEFSLEDLTNFNGIVISPYGEIIGTELWT
jgi:hypothetical protein